MTERTSKNSMLHIDGAQGEGGGQILQRWSFAGHSEAQYRFFELLLRETPAWSGDAPAAEAWLRAAVAQGNENARDRQLRRAAKQR